MLNFNDKTPKKIKCNNKNVAEVIYNGITVFLRKLANIKGLTPLTLENSTGETFEEFLIEGNSTQETRSGKNLLKITVTSQVKYGITITVNDDKSITLNGTNDIGSPIWIRLAPDFDIKAGTYTLSNGNSTVTGGTFVFCDDGYLFDRKPYSTKTFTETKTVKPYIRIANGVTINNQTIYPMIAEGTDTDYEPYGAMPSPEFPSEIKSAGEYINLWDEETRLGFYNDNGVWTTRSDILSSKNPIYVNSKETYYFVIPSRMFYTEWKKDGTFISRKTLLTSGTITANENTSYIHFNILDGYGTTYKNDIAIIKGTKGNYTSHQLTINEVIQNKNLFDKNNTVDNYYMDYLTGNKMYNESRCISNKIKIKPNTQYYMTTLGLCHICYFDKDNNYITGERQTETITSPNNAVYMYYSPLLTEKNTTQLIEGTSTPTDYIPHQNQNISIPVQKPMRSSKDGTVRDDFVNIDGNWFERHNIKELVLDGSDDENWTFGANDEFKFYRYSNILDYKYRSSNINTLCNQFVKASISSNNTELGYTILSDGQFRAREETKKKDLTEWRKYLSEHPIKIQYELEEPELLPCTEQQIEAINSLKEATTYEDVTYINSEDETPAYLDIKYYKNKN